MYGVEEYRLRRSSAMRNQDGGTDPVAAGQPVAQPVVPSRSQADSRSTFQRSSRPCLLSVRARPVLVKRRVLP